MAANIVALRVSRGHAELLGELVFSIRMHVHFKEELLRILQRLLKPFWQRIVAATQGVDRPDQIEGLLNIGDSPNAAGACIGGLGEHQSDRKQSYYRGRTGQGRTHGFFYDS